MVGGASLFSRQSQGSSANYSGSPGMSGSLGMLGEQCFGRWIFPPAARKRVLKRSVGNRHAWSLSREPEERFSCQEYYSIRLRGLVNGLEIQRAYTPITPVDAEGYFDVLIKCYESGLMSQYVKSWKLGEAVFWRGPFGGFPYRPNQYGELFMLASGTGLAPMLPIIQHITENENDETFVTLVGCFRTFGNIYMKPLLQDQSQFWNIRTFYVLSQEHSLENLPWSYQKNTHLGRINENMLRSMMNTCRRQPFVLICGSVAFTDDMERYLKAIGLQKDSYFVF
ncbi:NADH-cytochrome b5 reductase-like isoform X3 [Sphaerodactylus townsendi]|uniref:NADH-cytochrome b5 reductase-like isoform X3 n=1 Tax=Sphaerodactylus townsendi TaxID=933632 RepID=UPI002025CBDC|nr:NADH-cytochrome b5 reductase-like isoform X3 [Sphaerodactylus townsendi]